MVAPAAADERAGGRRLAAAVVGSFALGVVVGGLVGSLMYSMVPSEDGEYADLGRAIVALGAAVVVGGAVFVGLVVRAVRRTVPAGVQLRTVLAILGVSALAFVLLFWIWKAGGRTGITALSPIASLLVLAAGAAAIGGAAAFVPRRRVALVAAGTLMVLALLVVVPRRSADAAAERREVERYEQNGAPLALFGGTDLDAGFVGWDLELVDGGWFPGHVMVEFEVVDAPIHHRRVQLVFEADPEPIDCRVAPCEVLGRRPDGVPILRRVAGGIEGQGGVVQTWVDVEGGRWRVDGVTAEVDPESALAVLQALEAVDAGAFAAGT